MKPGWTPRRILFHHLVVIGLTGAASSAAAPIVEFRRTDYPTRHEPTAVIAGDLNRDGSLDLVVANSGTTTITRLLGNGDGSFGPPAEFTVGSAPFSIAIGDLDADGAADLAVANLGSHTISILRGDGTGGFASPTDIPIGRSPVAVSIADFDTDGRPDLVAAIHGEHSIAILRGDGRGGFGPAARFAIGDYPYAMAVGDLDGDGRPDVVAVNHIDSLVAIRRGDGAGGLGPIRTYRSGEYPTSVAMGDLDGDGLPDLAIANHLSHTVSILFGTGGGEFGGRVDLATGSRPMTALIADLSGDGRPDLAVTNREPHTFTVLPTSTSGEFETGFDFATGRSPWSILSADFDADGALDLAVTNWADYTVSVLIARRDGEESSIGFDTRPNPSLWGQAVTFSASVTPSTASGIVEFREGRRVLGTAFLQDGGASMDIADLGKGAHVLTALYRGDSLHRGCLSLERIHTVRGLTPSITVNSSANPANFSRPVAFTARVVAADPAGASPSGEVTFEIDGMAFGGAVPLLEGRATSQTIRTLAAGDHEVRAFYDGDPAFESGASPILTQIVRPIDRQAPVAECPADTLIRACGPPGRFVSFVATARDDQDPEPSIVCEPPPGSVFPIGATIVTCTSSDKSGNTGMCQFTVTVADSSCPVDSTARVDAVRIAEIGLACANGDTTVQFIELAAEGEPQVLSRDLRLRVLDSAGNLRFDEANLFLGTLEGREWPAGASWLLGTTSLGSVGVGPDRTIGAVLDPRGGRVSLLFPQGESHRTIHEVWYGLSGGPAAPPPGSSLQRGVGGDMHESPTPDPRRFDGSVGNGLHCECPTNRIAHCGGTTTSSQPAASGNGICQIIGTSGSSGGDYDLHRGTVRAFGGGSDCYNHHSSGHATTDVSDVFYVTGVPAATPVTFAIELRLQLRSSECPNFPQGGYGFGSGAITIGATVLSARSHGSDLDSTLRADMTVPAGHPFTLGFTCEAGGLAGGHGLAAGQWAFTGLPPGARVASCQGFAGDQVVPVRAFLESADVHPDRVRLRWQVPASSSPLYV